MASMIEELITTLESEEALCRELIPISEKKAKAVIENDLPALEVITGEEQEILDKTATLESKRMGIVSNIEEVMNRRGTNMNLKDIIAILDKQPEEQKKLQAVHDKLKLTAGRLKDINVKNKDLIEASLEMIEYNMNVIRSTRMSSGSSNYSSNASESDAFVGGEGLFDAKQ